MSFYVDSIVQRWAGDKPIIQTQTGRTDSPAVGRFSRSAGLSGFLSDSPIHPSLRVAVSFELITELEEKARSVRHRATIKDASPLTVERTSFALLSFSKKITWLCMK
jgi:hypothetical protein